MRTILWVILIGSALLFLIAFLFQFHRLRHDHYAQPGRLAVVFNWLLIVCFVGSLGGLVWTGFHPQPVGGETTSSSVKTTHSTRVHHGYSKVSWKPHDLTLGDDGDAVTTFKIPAKTTVKIIGARTQTVYKTFKAEKHDRKVKYHFEYAAQYEIEIIDKNGHHQKRMVTVKDNGSSSTISSSSSSVASSASQASSAPTTATSNTMGTGTAVSRGGSQTATTPAQSQSNVQTGGPVGPGAGGQQ